MQSATSYWWWWSHWRNLHCWSAGRRCPPGGRSAALKLRCRVRARGPQGTVLITSTSPRSPDSEREVHGSAVREIQPAVIGVGPRQIEDHVRSAVPATALDADAPAVDDVHSRVEDHAIAVSDTNCGSARRPAIHPGAQVGVGRVPRSRTDVDSSIPRGARGAARASGVLAIGRGTTGPDAVGPGDIEVCERIGHRACDSREARADRPAIIVLNARTGWIGDCGFPLVVMFALPTTNPASALLEFT